MMNNESIVDLNAGIFDMDEDIPPVENPNYDIDKLIQIVQRTHLTLLSHASSSSMFSNSSTSSSRPASRLDNLTTSHSALSSPRPQTRQCFTPSPYFWQVSVPTSPIPPTGNDGIALSFRDVFEEPECFLSKELFDESASEESDSEESEISTVHRNNGPMTHNELEALRNQPGRPITDDMFDSSDEDEIEVQHPFEF
jgi:hypothetical protein